MRPHLLILCLIALCGCGTTTGDASGLQKYLDEREICDHVRGEVPDPSNKEDADEVINSINTYCKDADNKLASMKRRFKDDPEAMRRLNTIEASIESKGMKIK